MGKSKSLVPQLLLILVGSAMCILVGFFFFGFNVFRIQRTSFQFVVTGISGSIFYTLIKYHNLRSASLVLSGLLLLTLWLSGVRTHFRISVIALHSITIGVSLFVYYKYIVRRLPSVRVGKFLIFTIIYTLIGFSLTLIYGNIFQFPNLSYNLRLMINHWIYNSMGLAFGLEIAELILRAKDVKRGRQRINFT